MSIYVCSWYVLFFAGCSKFTQRPPVYMRNINFWLWHHMSCPTNVPDYVHLSLCSSYHIPQFLSISFGKISICRIDELIGMSLLWLLFEYIANDLDCFEELFNRKLKQPVTMSQAVSGWVLYISIHRDVYWYHSHRRNILSMIKQGTNGHKIHAFWRWIIW